MATYSGSDKRLQYLFQHGGGGSLEDLDDVEITNPSDGDALVYDGEEEKWVNGEGGGGNANEQVLTKAEYDALTEEQKMNNTTYYINDADTWTSKEVQPVIYSTDEREIGVWTDGKPLYQKTMIINNPSINNWNEYDIGVPDLDKVIKQEGTFDRDIGSGDVWTYDLNAVNEQSFNTSYIVLARIRNATKKLAIYVGGTYPNSVIRFTFRYTKTTDQAGSGIYTPQGQLAVHYSTDEHVIGTWIDGRPLYEKTIDCGLIANDTSSHEIAHNISNIERCISCNTILIKNDEEHFANAYRPTQTMGILVWRSGANIKYINNWLEANAIRMYATLQYTKTTD